MIPKEDFAQKLKVEIVRLQKILNVLQLKKPSHTFLFPTIGNALVSMTDLLIYLEGKNPYYPSFDEPLFNNRQAAMHRSFFGDLHAGVEEGLRKIIDDNKFEVSVSREDLAVGIVKSIRDKLGDTKLISEELGKITKLGGTRPTFNDYLNTVLDNIPGLGKKYHKAARIYFDGLSIIRNKVSHSDMSLTDDEKKRLIDAKLGNTISKDGDLQMFPEGYKPLIKDAIRFFDNLYAHL